MLGQEAPPRTSIQRLHVAIRGAVQGVGFRPFIYRLATEMDLVGWVNNSALGVFIEVEGTHDALDQFLLRIEREKPPRSFIQSLEASYLEPRGYNAFEIRPSDASGVKSALILPDIATCPDCLAEVFDPANRRYLYPFTNCTNCGPRFSIMTGLPYDRPNTTMRAFAMCPECRAEYDDPLDRRFHAQPTACPVCGPHLELWDAGGRVLTACHDALLGAVAAIRGGAVVAVKGIGGFHLMVDAGNEDAVLRLRQRKHREEKPLALMSPSLEYARRVCHISALEERLLCAPESPIVLLRRRADIRGIAPSVAPGNPYLGIMLPYTPLHHLLMSQLTAPIVATSGNLTDEPICTDEREALGRLGAIADLLLVHNRPIARHVDDSIARVQMGRELVQRRARGYAPLPVCLRRTMPPTLAVGAHLKNSVALVVGRQVFVSQHIGDLETPQAHAAFCRVIADLTRLYETQPSAIAHDLHPDYLSTAYARQSGLTALGVQHHVAHILSCLAENEVEGPALGVSWDGTGYGPDGTIWGGEFFVIDGPAVTRAAHLRTFALPGGERAIKEPRRTAIGLLYEMLGDRLFGLTDLAPLQMCSQEERAVWRAMLAGNLNAPRTSSVGRLFDAVAAIVGLCMATSFEGRAAMGLEFAIGDPATDEAYDVALVPAPGGSAVVDWEPLVHAILRDVRTGVPTGRIAARFHNALAAAIVSVAVHVGREQVVLSGGCFQNAYLAEQAIRRLRAAGFRPFWHQRIPPNDGGIALGQIVAATSYKECAYVSGSTG